MLRRDVRRLVYVCRPELRDAVRAYHYNHEDVGDDEDVGEVDVADVV